VYANSASGGGGISVVQGSVTGGIVSGNQAFGTNADHSGGGLYVKNGELADMTIDGNAAGSGGGVELAPPASLTNVSVTNNQATYGAGIHSYLGSGGGSISLTSTRVSGNQADRTGGGLEADDVPATVTVTVTDSSFTDNTAVQGGGGIDIAR